MPDTNASVFDGSLSEPPPVTDAAIARAMEILQSGRLFRYGEEQSECSEATALEEEFALFLGVKYCVGVNSCGSALFIALKASGLQYGDPVLFNAFTLAPVPGAIAHAGGVPVPVEITPDCVIALDHLKQQQQKTGAKHLLLSHMRGHIADMDRVVQCCRDLGLTLIEDCAHTMGATWDGRLSGTFGDVACFSTQSFKHVNSGEGGLLVTSDDDVAAKAILYSGSYGLYGQHRARPTLELIAKHAGHVPNCSMRMSNLVAALIRPQIPELPDRISRWRRSYQILCEHLSQVDGIQLLYRDPREGFAPSSLQFSLIDLPRERAPRFIDKCRQHGVHIKWFGNHETDGFTERLEHWQYFRAADNCPDTHKTLIRLCDLRIPLNLTARDCTLITKVIGESLEQSLSD